VEEISMNAIPSDWVSQEEDTEVVHEVEDGLVEVGAVSETKGGISGWHPDNGSGYAYF
jgi:hypothetical protein